MPLRIEGVQSLKGLCSEAVAKHMNYFMDMYRDSWHLVQPEQRPLFGPFSKLPVELFEGILRALKRNQTMTSRTLMVLLHEKVKVFELCPKDDQDEVETLHQFGIASKRCKNLKTLRLVIDYPSRRGRTMGIIVNAGIRRLEFLVKICFHYNGIEDNTVKVVATTCRHLKFLNLQHSSIRDEGLTYLFMNDSLVNNTLVYLNVANTLATPYGNASLIMFLPKLEIFMSETMMQTIAYLYYFLKDRKSHKAKLPRYPFTVLRGVLSSCTETGIYAKEVVKGIKAMCPKTDTLILEGIPECMHYIISAFNTLNISSLSIICPQQYDKTIFSVLTIYLYDRGHLIESLKLQNFYKVSLVTIAATCPNLKHLTLLCNKFREEEEELNNMPLNLPNIRSFTIIAKLPRTINLFLRDMDESTLGYAHILSILCSPNLEAAMFQDQVSLTDDLLTQAIKKSGLKNLQRFTIYCCHRLSPLSIWQLLDTKNKLKHLEIGECTLICIVHIKKFQDYAKENNLDVKITNTNFEYIRNSPYTDYGVPQCMVCPPKDHKTPFEYYLKTKPEREEF